jgi:nicotinamidase-related amidase
MTWRIFALLIGVIAATGVTTEQSRVVSLRSRVHLFHASEEWSEVHADFRFEPAKAAVIVCDMWDKHWCSGANVRVAALVAKLEPFLEEVRKKGITVVHSPSDTMAYYATAPQREKMRRLPHFAPPSELAISAPELPIDDSDGGCDTPGDTEHRAWKCENSGLRIAPRDFISDDGQEIYNLLRLRGIDTVFYTGVHVNMCILNRSFAIRQMTKWGVKCVLLRDLTDAMYNPKDAPHVSHEQGTELVIEYIEKYWAPTALSRELMQSLRD